jgi:plastocyanin
MLQIAWILMLLGVPVVTGTAKRQTITMSAFQFAPSEVHVAVGDTVIWQNRDIVPHTATAANKAWDSGDIPAKSKRRTVMRIRGEYVFTCLYHSNMKGKLVVK